MALLVETASTNAVVVIGVPETKQQNIFKDYFKDVHKHIHILWNWWIQICFLQVFHFKDKYMSRKFQMRISVFVVNFALSVYLSEWIREHKYWSPNLQITNAFCHNICYPITPWYRCCRLKVYVLHLTIFLQRLRYYVWDILVVTISGTSVLLNGIKLLLEQLSTYHQWRIMAFTWLENCTFKTTATSRRGQWVAL